MLFRIRCVVFCVMLSVLIQESRQGGMCAKEEPVDDDSNKDMEARIKRYLNSEPTSAENLLPKRNCTGECTGVKCIDPPEEDCHSYEWVRRPGICACCMQCGARLGEQCGLYVKRCLPGSRCLPNVNSKNPVLAIIEGDATCFSNDDPY